MHREAILTAALIAVAVPLQAPQAASPQNEFTPEQLREDLAVLRGSLEEGHGDSIATRLKPRWTWCLMEPRGLSPHR